MPLEQLTSSSRKFPLNELAAESEHDHQHQEVLEFSLHGYHGIEIRGQTLPAIDLGFRRRGLELRRILRHLGKVIGFDGDFRYG